MNTKPTSLFALFDAARMGVAMTDAKERFPERFATLYRGESAKNLADFAPYLFWFDAADSTLKDWFPANGWGKSWGVFLRSRTSVEELYRHFRRYLIIADETGRELYFRFYDPRVLREFLLTCTSTQLTEFFGPVQQFFMEDEDPNFSLCFWLEAGQLNCRRVNKEVDSEFAFLTSPSPAGNTPLF
ncbi:MAG: DUF4123 domain-containing protein [Spirosoma sp.]|nr:DUF4123 domain-containing protein [Spirosoma sp.]